MSFILKTLGSIDAAAALAFLMLMFGIQPWLQFLLFCAGLLFLKGLFVFTGDFLSIVDLASSVILIVTLFLTPPIAFLWIPALLLLSKAVVSFL